LKVRPLRPTTLLMNNSKRAFSLIVGASAALAAGSLGATSAKAQLTNMLQSGIQRPTAGITIGQTTMAKGTIQYTNSAGTNDSFSVGTSTSIAANASASSTSDYSVTSVASFDMGNNNTDGPGGLSVISQQIGRAQESTQTKSLDTKLQTNLAETAAKKSAEMTASSFKAVDGSGNAIDIAAVGFDTVVSMAAGDSSIELSIWTNNQWQEFESDPAGVGAQTAVDKFSAAYEAQETLNYDEAFTEAVSEASFAAEGSGIISGKFEKSAGQSETTNFESVSQVNAGTGEIVSDSDFTEFAVTDSVKTALESYQADQALSSPTGVASSITVDGSTFDFTNTETVDAIESTESGSSYAVSTANNSTFALDTVVTQNSSFKQIAPTTNTVSVQGINSENNIVSDDSAEFSSTITKDITADVTSTSGTASGSATGNVTTTASASASSSSFINSFVQAY
jgi:hypothetical protein